MGGQLELGMFSEFFEKRPVAIPERFLEDRAKISDWLVVMDRQQKIEPFVIHGRFPEYLKATSKMAGSMAYNPSSART
jgi:hypothetical protein